MDAWLQIILIAIIAFIIWKALAWHKNYKQITKAANKLTPVGGTHPIWGNLHLTSDLQDLVKLNRQVVLKTKAKMLVFWRMLMPSITTVHPDAAKVLMKSLAPKPKYKDSGYHSLRPWLGDGLLLSDGKKWERNRRLLTPAFHFSVLRPYTKIYNEVADICLDKLWKCSLEGKKSVEIYDPVGLATLDVMLRCALSYEGHVQEQGSTHPYVQAVKNLSQCIIYRSLRPWLFPDWLFRLTSAGKEFFKICDYVHDFADKIISSRRTALNENGASKTRHLDFLDILLTSKDENGVGLTDKEIREEVDTFLFEGHDTTASGISWALYCLSKYPDEQQKVYEEISDILKNKSKVEWDDIPKLNYLSLFLKEVFRKYPPVTGIGRVLHKKMEINGITFPKGSNIGISIRNIHNHPDVWQDYEAFRPERFLENRDPYSFVPFSAGPRNCIGQHFAMHEQKVLLSRIVQRFKMKLDPSHTVEEVSSLVLRAKNGIKIKLEKR